MGNTIKNSDTLPVTCGNDIIEIPELQFAKLYSLGYINDDGEWTLPENWEIAQILSNSV